MAAAAHGRFVLGVGAGSTAADFTAFGIGFSEGQPVADPSGHRVRRMDRVRSLEDPAGDGAGPRPLPRSRWGAASGGRNVDARRPDAADVLAAPAEAGFDDAIVVVERHDDEHLEQARRLWPG